MKALSVGLLVAGAVGLLVAGAAMADLRIGMTTGEIPEGPLHFIASTPWLVFGLFGASPVCLIAGVILHGRRPRHAPEAKGAGDG